MMLAVRKFALFWMPVLVCMLVIYLMSNTRSSTLEQIGEGARILPQFVSDILISQYFVHPIEFGVLSALTYRLLRSYKPISIRVVVSATITWTITYAILDEIHQSFVVGRSSTISDVGLDTGGILVSLILILLFGRRLRALIASIK